MASEHSHRKHHLEQAIKNLLAVEDHLENEPCAECINKHLMLVEQLLEEEYHISQDQRLRSLVEEARRLRRDPDPVLARELRRKLQQILGIAHTQKPREIVGVISR